MAAWRISGNNFSGQARLAGRARTGRVALSILALLAALATAGSGLRHAHAQAARQPGRQSSSQAAAQPDAQADTSSDAKSGSDANSSLDDPPPVLPTDPPGWKPEVLSKDAPAAKIPKDAPATSAATGAASVTSPDSSKSALPRVGDAAAPGPAMPAVIPLPTDPRQRRVAIVSADLLRMATDLKAAVDKSNKDELSVAVVRKAGEIEQYARKVRDGTRLSAGKE